MNFNLENVNLRQSKLFSGFKKVLDQNAPTLATFGSILGVIGTVYFMHKAAKEAARVEEDFEDEVKALEEQKEVEELNEQEVKEEMRHLKVNRVVNLVTVYRWALLSGIGSAGFAILSNYLNGRTIAALTGFLALNNEKLKEYAVKGKEMLGEEKFKELQENVERDILGKKIEKGEVKAEKPGKKLIAKDEDQPEEGLTRFYIPLTDEMWDLPEWRVKDAIAEASRLEYLNWNDFRNMCGYASCRSGYWMCWEAEKKNVFKAHIGYVNVGIGGMKAIIFDNEPDFDKANR